MYIHVHVGFLIVIVYKHTLVSLAYNTCIHNNYVCFSLFQFHFIDLDEHVGQYHHVKYVSVTVQ